nr:anucleate primary sterigmata protein a [Quercus suber]
MNSNATKKRESQKTKRAVKLGGLGVARSSTTEVFEDEPEWEDHEGERTPSKSNFIHESESSDAFETATERGLTTENEAFETGQEDVAASDSDELTETEGTMHRSSHRSRVASGISSRPGDRASFMSTASTSADEAEEIKTPVHNHQPKYRLRMGGVNGRRNGRVDDVVTESPTNGSPTSSIGTPQPPGQSLGDELDALDEGSLGGTPSRFTEESFNSPRTPETQRHVSVEPEDAPSDLTREDELTNNRARDIDGRGLLSPPRSARFAHDTVRGPPPDAAIFTMEQTKPKPEMVSSGMMTEPWEPEKTAEKQSLGERAGEVVAGALGGALAGFGLGRAGPKPSSDGTHDVQSADSDDTLAVSSHTEQQSPAAVNGDSPDISRLAQDSSELSGDKSGDVITSHKETTGLHTAEAAVDGTSSPDSSALPVAENMGLKQSMSALPVLQHAVIITQETQPIEPVQASEEADIDQSASQTGPEAAAAVVGTPSEPAVAPGLSVHDGPSPQPLTFSSVQSQHFEPASFPTVPITPVVPYRSSRRPRTPSVAGDAPDEADQEADHAVIPGTDAAPPGTSFLAAVASAHLQTSGVRDGQQNQLPMSNEVREQPVIVARQPLAESHPNIVRDKQPELQRDLLAFPAPLKIKKSMADQGAQTAVSGDDVESMLRHKKKGTSGVDASNSPMKPHRRSIDGTAVIVDPQISRSPRRPASAGSIRGKTNMPPPLPEDHMLQIAAAVQKVPATSGPSAVGTMGPPLMPASAYKTARPRTPAERATERAMSRDGTTPRPPRVRDSRGHYSSPGGVSRRTSMSSFASELDERFNITRGHVMYPNDVEPATDPRMIQAITQTMIGEYLWKYTRKAGRSETSNTRHRRFFWIHPYTRTLYWSEQDPSAAVPHMLKSKSLTIQAVRVITDDNPMPPGLHRKTLVIVTPGREIMMTAQTGQRHETWFNALSYLLLRTDQEKAEADDVINEEDLEEFNPGFNIRQSINKFTGRDRSVGSHHRTSLSSYNSRTSSAAPNQSTMTQRYANATAKTQAAPTGTSSAAAGATGAAAANAGSRTSSAPSDSKNEGNRAGRFSSITSAFRRGSNQHGTSSTIRGRSRVSIRGHSAGEQGEIYNASVAADSAEELRAVMARQESEASQLENVRACCDGESFSPCLLPKCHSALYYAMHTLTHEILSGKHDVGSLSRTGRHSHGGLEGHTHASLTSRFGSHSHR